MSNKYNKIFQDFYYSGNIEETIEILKKNGASQMDTLKTLMDELNLSIRDADTLVMNSIAWKDNKSGNQTFRDLFMHTLNNLNGQIKSEDTCNNE